jgi:hypothetical protein
MVARKKTAFSSPAACGTTTGIFSSSFAGACVATEDGLETVRSDLIERAVIAGKIHAPA